MQQENGQASMVVEKGCESCRKWQEHYYWEHMDVTKIRFFKLMTGDFSKGISIPDKFAKNFKGQISRGFELKAPSGETWHMSVEKRGDELFLMSGWEDFVKAHELQENDLLLFTCCGNSSFQVLVFEASGCEKASSLFGSRISPDMCKHVNDIAGQHGEQHFSVSDSEDTTTPSQHIGSYQNASSSKKSCGKTKPSESEYPNTSNFVAKHPAIGEEDSDDEYAKSNCYYSMFANRLRDDIKEEIIGLASIQLNNPAFVTVLMKKHVQRRNNALIIPSRFAADHLEERAHDIIFRRPNRKEKWLVSYYYSHYMRSFRNLAFFKFVHDNKLREGDICVFELMKGKRRVTMTIHVIRNANGRFILVG
ncbi:B3 domain-containing protein_Os12g40090 [Setaria viridis]|uniref:TF-B3 domain-containing protein n=1 Tax=Setaria viridis TaxID=4556 RepID=A0A4V6DDJ1_SETVI|nr:B3 domain-containing protein Os12g0592300-like [Setaria viridis]TKW29346.1 hypothetical protein SEVIR_3G389800v2 [Setaria viridis]